MGGGKKSERGRRRHSGCLVVVERAFQLTGEGWQEPQNARPFMGEQQGVNSGLGRASGFFEPVGVFSYGKYPGSNKKGTHLWKCDVRIFSNDNGRNWNIVKREQPHF